MAASSIVSYPVKLTIEIGPSSETSLQLFVAGDKEAILESIRQILLQCDSAGTGCKLHIIKQSDKATHIIYELVGNAQFWWCPTLIERRDE